MKLEEKLVSLRKAKGLSQLKLSEMMNVSRQAISRWEVGAAIPSTENLKYLGNLYNVPLEYFLYDDLKNSEQPASERSTVNTEENHAHEDTGTRKLNKRIWLFSAVAIVIVFIIVSALFYFLGKEEATVKMGDMEGSEMITEKDFALEEW